MTAHIQPDSWLQFMGQEYLETFIRDGGSSVKFAVALDEQANQYVSDGFSKIAIQRGYLVARVSASDTKVHMMEEVFFRTAEQLSWGDLSRQVIRALAETAGYRWPAGESAQSAPALYERLAAENNVDSQMLLLDLKRQIGDHVFKERNLAKDFRVAMTHLCLAQLSGGSDGEHTVKVLTDWLTGRNKTISAVMPYHIFRKIDRSTARYFFESMTHWIRCAGHAGLVLLMDTSRLLVPRDPQDRSLFYSKAAVLDAYELLRQFIDGADRVSSYLMIVMPSFAFLEDLSRGLSAYEALKFRVFDEIRDKVLVNPMASLVRIASNNGRQHDS